MNRLRLATLCRSLSRNRLYSTATADGTALSYGGSSFPYRWLRDSCQCPNCVHPSTKQKLHRTSDIREDVKPAPHGVRVTEKGVDIAWSSGHDSHYAKEFLELYASPTKLNAFHRDEVAKQWGVSELQKAKDLFLPYESLQTPSGMLKAITQLNRYGLLFTTGIPNQKTSHEECELTTLANKFGEIRETFYGKVWDVKNIRNSRNIAYTNIDLGLHMDILYFQDPPRFQILHCLRNSVQGGMSVFVDSLHAADVLRESDPEAFDVLASTPIEFHYINDGHHLHYAHPTIELAPLSSTDCAPRPIAHLNYSPPFQAPLPLSTPKAFYPAFERFVALLEDSSSRFEYTLREGDAVLFDNRRVLHARTAFTGGEEPGQAGDQTNRWLKGCYLEADAVWDRGRVLAERLEKGE